MQKIHPNRKHNYDEIASLINQGFTDRQVSKIVNCSASTVQKVRETFKLRLDTDYRCNSPVELTEYQKECLFGTVLGDGYLRPHRRSYTGRIDHCLKQKEYWEWKCRVFHNLISLTKCEERKCTSCKSGRSHSCYLTFKSNMYLKFFFDIFYVPKKEIPIEYLEVYYTPLAFAVHFMDDGSRAGTSGYKLMTMGFPLENIKLYQQFLTRKYGLFTGLDKKNNVTFNKENAKKLTLIIKDFVVPSMQYKIHQQWIVKGQSSQRPVSCTDIRTNQILLFDSQRELSKFLKISESTVTNYLSSGKPYKNYSIQRL
jgi:hypothetical protein